MAAAQRIDGDRPRALTHDIDDLGVGDEANTRREQTMMEKVEQDRPANAEPERLGMQIAVGEIEDRSSLLVLSEQTVDAGTCRERGLNQAEGTQHGEAGGLQQQAGAHRSRLPKRSSTLTRCPESARKLAAA